MLAEDSLSLFVRDTKVQLLFYNWRYMCSWLNECLVLSFTLRVLLATDSGIKSSARATKKNITRSALVYIAYCSAEADANAIPFAF